jgi:glycosyltransferase involved in cell wall biosynthesis
MKRQSNVNPWPQARFSFAFVRRSLLGHIKSFKPDVIYAHHTWVSGYVAYRIKEITGIPYVITDHALDEIGDCACFPKRRSFFREVQVGAAAMVDVSNRMQHIRRGIFPEVASVVVHNGADPVPDEMFRTPRPAELAGKLIVCTVAGWSPSKGTPKLVEAFGNAAAGLPNVVLRLIGDGPDRPAVMAAIRATACRERISALGAQPHERALQEMCWADVFAMIGRDESYGVVFTEAMMAGLPLIWPSDCGHNDVLVGGVNGVRIPPWDVAATTIALRRLLEDAELRRRTGETNREFAEKNLTWDANAKEMAEIFAGIAASHRQRCEPKGCPS